LSLLFLSFGLQARTAVSVRPANPDPRNHLSLSVSFSNRFCGASCVTRTFTFHFQCSSASKTKSKTLFLLSSGDTTRMAAISLPLALSLSRSLFWCFLIHFKNSACALSLRPRCPFPIPANHAVVLLPLPTPNHAPHSHWQPRFLPNLTAPGLRIDTAIVQLIMTTE